MDECRNDVDDDDDYTDCNSFNWHNLSISVRIRWIVCSNFCTGNFWTFRISVWIIDELLRVLGSFRTWNPFVVPYVECFKYILYIFFGIASHIASMHPSIHRSTYVKCNFVCIGRTQGWYIFNILVFEVNKEWECTLCVWWCCVNDGDVGCG